MFESQFNLTFLVPWHSEGGRGAINQFTSSEKISIQVKFYVPSCRSDYLMIHGFTLLVGLPAILRLTGHLAYSSNGIQISTNLLCHLMPVTNSKARLTAAANSGLPSSLGKVLLPCSLSVTWASFSLQENTFNQLFIFSFSSLWFPACQTSFSSLHYHPVLYSLLSCFCIRICLQYLADLEKTGLGSLGNPRSWSNLQIKLLTIWRKNQELLLKGGICCGALSLSF